MNKIYLLLVCGDHRLEGHFPANRIVALVEFFLTANAQREQP